MSGIAISFRGGSCCHKAYLERSGKGLVHPFREVAKHGAIPLGGAVLTCAGRLPFKGIIHVAGISMWWRACQGCWLRSPHKVVVRENGSTGLVGFEPRKTRMTRKNWGPAMWFVALAGVLVAVTTQGCGAGDGFDWAGENQPFVCFVFFVVN